MAPRKEGLSCVAKWLAWMLIEFDWLVYNLLFVGCLALFSCASGLLGFAWLGEVRWVWDYFLGGLSAVFGMLVRCCSLLYCRPTFWAASVAHASVCSRKGPRSVFLGAVVNLMLCAHLLANGLKMQLAAYRELL